MESSSVGATSFVAAHAAPSLEICAVIIIDNSNSGNTINIYGTAKVTDNSAGTTVNDYTTEDSLANIPTTAAFELRTLPSANYVVVGDTIAGVTACTTNTDMRGTDGVSLVVPDAAGVIAAFMGVAGVNLTEVGGDGAQLTAIDLPDQTMDILGTITGNLDGDVTGNVDGTVAGVTPEAGGVAPTAGEIKTAIEVDGGDLSSLMEALVNKLLITEASGNAEMFNDAGVSQGTVAAAFTSVAGVTQRKRMVI